jgi:hypothetical protein
MEIKGKINRSPDSTICYTIHLPGKPMYFNEEERDLLIARMLAWLLKAIIGIALLAGIFIVSC